MKKILIVITLIIIGILFYIYNIGIHTKKTESDPLYVEIHGNSMYPTLKNGEKYNIEEVDGCDGSIKSGDIVMFDIMGSDIKYIKRAKIIPGDKYEIGYEDNGSILRLIINGKQILKFRDYKNTKFYKTLLLWSGNTKNGKITSKQYAVFGDNLGNSIDTLEYGFIGCKKITHKVL